MGMWIIRLKNITVMGEMKLGNVDKASANSGQNSDTGVFEARQSGQPPLEKTPPYPSRCQAERHDTPLGLVGGTRVGTNDHHRLIIMQQ